MNTAQGKNIFNNDWHHQQQQKVVKEQEKGIELHEMYRQNKILLRYLEQIFVRWVNECDCVSLPFGRACNVHLMSSVECRRSNTGYRRAYSVW